MSKYAWKPHGIIIKENTIAIDPIVAFNKFVAPGLTMTNWVENSRPVTDTSLRMREWAGLVIHCLSLMNLTGQYLTIGRDFNDGDGVLLRANDKGTTDFDGVYIEQTLVTYHAHNDLAHGVEAELNAKSSRGVNYSLNKHLIIWCNINGSFDHQELANIISNGGFNIVDIIGFNDSGRHYQSLVFDKDKSDGPINNFIVFENDLLNT